MSLPVRFVLVVVAVLVGACHAEAQDRPVVNVTVLAGGEWWRSYVVSHQAEFEDCVRRFVPDEASGVATVSGTVEGEHARFLRHPVGWSAPTLPYERFQICVDHLLEQLPSEAPVGESVRIGIAIRAEGGAASVGALDHVLGSAAPEGPAPSVPESVGVGGMSTAGAATREIVTPAHTTAWIESLDGDPPEHAREILEARAAGPFAACVAEVTSEEHVRFTVSVGDRGVVRAVRAVRSGLPVAARRCLERAIRAIQFLMPDGASRLSLRFTLGVQHHPAAVRRLTRARILAEEMRSEGPGRVELAAIARLLTGRGSALGRCHQGDDASGRIELTLTFAEDGRAGDVHATGYDEAVARCIERVGAGVRLTPAPRGGAATVHVVVELLLSD